MPEPTLSSVREAAERLAGVANRTPVVQSRTLNTRVGSEVFVKCENLQRSGSFKFRGAYNAIARLTEEERARGVLAYSSGNHAQALALAGKLLAVPTAIVMPNNAPRAKLAATRGYGAEVILYDPMTRIREEVAAQIQRERGSILIPPYDHPDVVSGQGTAALELLQEVGDLDLLVTPCGGGGLLSGSALAASEYAGCKVVGAEPELADDAARTFRTGVVQRVHNPPTIADGLRTPYLGEVTWPVIREHVTDIMTVTESQIVEAMRFLWTRMKLVVEPSGAVPLAALMSRSDLPKAARIGLIVSGGNVDLDTACSLFSAA